MNELDANLKVLEQKKEEIKLLDTEIIELEKSITKISNEYFLQYILYTIYIYVPSCIIYRLCEIDSLIELNKIKLNSLEENIKDKNIECDLIKSHISSIESKINSLVLGVKKRQMVNEEIRNKIVIRVY